VKCSFSWRTELQSVFDRRMNIRKEVMELEVSERILALKIYKKELIMNRLSQLVDEADHCQVTTTLCCCSCRCSGSMSN